MKNHLFGSWRAAQHYIGMLLYHLAQLESQDKNTSLFQEPQPSSAFNAFISSCHIQQDLSSFS